MAIMKTSVRRKEPQHPEPQEPKSSPVPLESLEDIAWELWLLVELLAPVRRRLPNTASQKLVDYVKDRLIAKSVALAKWKKARPELFPDSPIGARDVLPGENWIFPDHRTLAEVIEAERNPATVLSQTALNSSEPLPAPNRLRSQTNKSESLRGGTGHFQRPSPTPPWVES
jgi:hypothetical protein